jgi:phosphate transport system substrate-binding protein
MIRLRNTVAVLAFTALFGCAVESPASTPTLEQIDLRIHTTHATQPLTRNLADAFTIDRPEFNISISEQSYGVLIDALNNGQIDYFMSNYVPVRDNIWAAPMAQDGLLLIVNQDNPITDLPNETIRDIFGGQTTNWNTFSGENHPIIPLTYTDSDDIYHEFHRLIMGQRRITSNAQVVPNISAMIAQVASNRGAIGYIPFSHNNSTTRALHIDGIAPNTEQLVSNIYPLRTTIFVIGRADPPPQFRTFFSWVQSDIGQASLGAQYIPLP